MKPGGIACALVAVVGCSSGYEPTPTPAASSEPRFELTGLRDGRVSLCADSTAPVTAELTIENKRSENLRIKTSGLGASVSPGELILLPNQNEVLKVTVRESRTDRSSTQIFIETSVDKPGSLDPPDKEEVAIGVDVEVDERLLALDAKTTHLLGHEAVRVTVTNPTKFVASGDLAFDGPFIARVAPESLAKPGGPFTDYLVQIAAGGVPGEPVRANARFLGSRCSSKDLPAPPPLPFEGLRSQAVARVATGDAHTCVLTTGGGVFCWGENGASQLARPLVDLPDGGTTVPLPTPGLGSGVTALAAGRAHTCAIQGTNLLCWGDCKEGQCGPAAAKDFVPTPTMVPLPYAPSRVYARQDFTCAMLPTGASLCWGRIHGASSAEPSPLAGVLGAVQLAIGTEHGCARTSDGAVRCWGAAGRVGDGTETPSSTPVLVLEGAADLAAGDEHTCAVTTVGTARCWGNFHRSRFGMPTKYLSPTLIPSGSTGLASSTLVAAAGRATCFVSTTVVSFGVDLGAIAKGVTGLDTGGRHACGVFAGGRLLCVGENATAVQLGPRAGPNGIYGFDGAP